MLETQWEISHSLLIVLYVVKAEECVRVCGVYMVCVIRFCVGGIKAKECAMCMWCV